MDEEMVVYMDDLVIDEFSCSEIDPEYEFDACQFFDLSRDETDSEAQQAESWFRYAREYPPSPFIVKLRLLKPSEDVPVKVHTTGSKRVEAEEHAGASSISSGDIDREDSSIEGKTKATQDIAKTTSKSSVKLSKPRSSTLMKPTASQLAKQNKARDVHGRLPGRLQKLLVKTGERLQIPPAHELDATKRQKLEIGYLRKVAQLKHQTSFSHKTAKKVGQPEASTNSKSKTTVPRKPDLVTAERAQSRRYQSKSESGQEAKTKTHAFRARPLNRKILKAPSLPLRKKSMPQFTEFQEFHFKTTERAMHHQSTNVPNTHNSSSATQTEEKPFKRQSSGKALKKEKCESPRKSKACSPDKVYPVKYGDCILNVKQESHLPPTELFKKLSLKPESGTTILSPSKLHRPTKALKENTPRSFQHECWRYAGKPNQCGSDRRIPEAGSQHNINRSVDIR